MKERFLSRLAILESAPREMIRMWPDIAGAAKAWLSRIARLPDGGFVVPTLRGGVRFEWHNRGFTLELEFISPDRIEYLKAGPGDEWEEGVLSVDDVTGAQCLLDWFIVRSEIAATD